MSGVMDISAQDFIEKVLKSEVPVLVDFWSPTCGPCRIMVPILDELAAENGDDYLFAKVNVYEAPQIGSQYGVDMLPTLLFFYQGRVVERMLGVQDKERLQEALDEIG